MDEQRVATRRRILKTGTIEFSSGSVPCTVRNISDSGAALDLTSPLWFPEQFVLGIASDGTSRKCRVVWRRDRKIGVAFE